MTIGHYPLRTSKYPAMGGTTAVAFLSTKLSASCSRSWQLGICA